MSSCEFKNRIMLEKIDKIQELLNVPNVDASTETAIANMKILNLLVDLRAETKQLILSGVVSTSKCEHEPRYYDTKYTSCKKCNKVLQMKP
jgi:translation initiation factor 2 beta subunit (eIF-2beta)/eIF-5